MNEKYKIHAVYILFILVSVIIVLVTVRWSQIPNLADLITFALTLSSLILAALAIGYAVYSNSSFSQSIATLNNVSRDVSETAKDISRATEDLSQKIEFIPSKLERMEDKVEQTNIMLRQYSERQEGQIPDQDERRAAGEIVDSFVAKISMSGIYILYSCALAYTKKVPFDLEDLSQTIDHLQRSYAQGFLIATDSAGLLTFNESKGLYNIIDMNERLRESLLQEFNSRLAGIDKDENWTGVLEKEQYKNMAREKLSKIDKYFQ